MEFKDRFREILYSFVGQLFLYNPEYVRKVSQ